MCSRLTIHTRAASDAQDPRLSWHEDSVFEFFFKSRRLKKAPARLELATFLMARRRRVAVLVDDSPGSMRACRYGAKHLLDKNTDVMLVTAVHDSHDPRAVRRSVYERAYASETPKGDGVPMFVVDRSDVCVQDGWFFFFFFFGAMSRGRWAATYHYDRAAHRRRPSRRVSPRLSLLRKKK